MTTAAMSWSHPISSGNPTTRRQRMSFWSRHDPVMMRFEGKQHWASLRTRAELLGRPQTAELERQMRNSQQRRGQPSQSAVSEDYAARIQKAEENGDGRIENRGVPIFSEVQLRDLHGNVPGNYTVVRPKTSPNRQLLRTSYNVRAREGFAYWHQDRPKPTSFGRYGIGSYKTVLGLGNAPRT